MSPRYASEHEWVVHAITGFLSAYYMEDARFRGLRRFQEPETGVHVWQCEAPGAKFMARLLKRLQADVPLFHLQDVALPGLDFTRMLIDAPNTVEGKRDS